MFYCSFRSHLLDVLINPCAVLYNNDNDNDYIIIIVLFFFFTILALDLDRGLAAKGPRPAIELRDA